jgi:hypothetical protein
MATGQRSHSSAPASMPAARIASSPRTAQAAALSSSSATAAPSSSESRIRSRNVRSRWLS